MFNPDSVVQGPFTSSTSFGPVGEPERSRLGASSGSQDPTLGNAAVSTSSNIGAQLNSGSHQASGDQAHLHRGTSTAGVQPSETLQAAQQHEDQSADPKSAPVPGGMDRAQLERFDTPQSLTQATSQTSAGDAGSTEDARSSSMPSIPSKGQGEKSEQSGMPTGTNTTAEGGTADQGASLGHHVPGAWATEGDANDRQSDKSAGHKAFQGHKAHKNGSKCPQAPYGSLSG
jgi:hypothetical protein